MDLATCPVKNLLPRETHSDGAVFLLTCKTLLIQKCDKECFRKYKQNDPEINSTFHLLGGIDTGCTTTYIDSRKHTHTQANSSSALPCWFVLLMYTVLLLQVVKVLPPNY